ncbi:melatonin receptor type 1B-A-like [Paramacrobiotus metropolitanus]|uniref:melatonin receptor type 1B-A-like n=1 Tax=Paramacrobiotus metropolitanus TaxID=2943436 RepID=UPI002445C762|nr:melatonin receptor type 1B-A-like [Paramacrobiotus metropolitanus]
MENSSVLMALAKVPMDMSVPGNATNWDVYVAQFDRQWEEHYTLNWIFIGIMSSLAAFGTLTNLFVLISLVLVLELHHCQYAFVGNLAFADILITAIVLPVIVAVLLKGPDMFRRHPWFCELEGSICASACAGSIWCIMAISVERYICICHHNLHSKLFTPLRTAGLIILLWIVANAIHAPNYLGWGRTGYTADLNLCTSELHLQSYSIFFGILAVIIPINISFYAYMQIYRRIRISRAGRRILVSHSRASTNSSADPTAPGIIPPMQLRAIRDEIQLAKALFKVFILFLLSWMPLGLFFILRSSVTFPKWYNFMGLILAHGSSATNSVIYFWMTDLLRTTKEGYRRLIRRAKANRVGLPGMLAKELNIKRMGSNLRTYEHHPDPVG